MGISTEVKLLQLAKAPVPILTKDGGNGISTRLPQSRKASLGIACKPEDKVTVVSVLQLSYAFLFSVVTVLGITTADKPSHSLKAETPILTKDEGNGTSARLPQYWKA